MPSSDAVYQTAAAAQRLSDAVCSVIRGADKTIALLVTAILCGGHVLLEDLPGTGKTTLVKALAAASGCDSKRIQCTPDLLPADLTGCEILSLQPDGTRRPVFRKGPVFTNLLLADEINRMAPRSQSGLLECMAEGQVTSGGETYALPEPFFVIATQNPVELQGTFPLPEAQRDRFFMRLSLGQPSHSDELEILRGRQSAEPLEEIRPVTSPEALCHIQKVVRQIHVSEAALEYLLAIAEATRRHTQIRFGLSTRGALALQRAAQGYAAFCGRDHVLPDDIKTVCPAVCCHRIYTADSLFTDESAAEAAIAEILQQTEVPKA